MSFISEIQTRLEHKYQYQVQFDLGDKIGKPRPVLCMEVNFELSCEMKIQPIYKYKKLAAPEACIKSEENFNKFPRTVIIETVLSVDSNMKIIK